MKCNLSFKASLIFFLLLNASFVVPDELTLAWNYFNENKIEDAREHFMLASQSADTKAEAELMLSILATIDQTPEEARKHFMLFYNSSTTPDPYLYALWSSESVNDGYGKKTKQQLNFLESLLEREDLNGTIRAMTLYMLASHYTESDDFKKVNKYFTQLQTVEQWQMVGTFENISASGFDKNYAPIDHPEMTYTFKNKSDADVHWFELKNHLPGRWIKFYYHFNTYNSIIYVQSFCNSPTEQIVQLRMGTSGSLKAWINDQIAYNEPEERNNGMDTYITSVQLHKGWNRILLQIGVSEIEHSNFMLRITDDKGNNIQGLSYSPSVKPYDKNSTYIPKQIPIFAESFFKQKIKEQPTNLLNYILLANVYMRNEKVYKARKVIETAQKMAPDNSYLLYQLIQVYSNNDNKTELSMAIEKMKQNDPSNPLSLELLYSEANDREDYEEAESILKQLKSRFPENESILIKEIQQASNNNDTEELLRLANKGYRKYPDSYTFVYFQYVIQKEVFENVNDAATIMIKYLKNNYSIDAYQILANLFFDLGNSNKGLNYKLKLIEKNPEAVGFYQQIGDLFFKLGRYKDAIDYYNKCLELAPYIGNIYGDLGQSYKELGDDSKAIDNYKKDIYYNPTDYDRRKELRKLNGKAEIFSYFTQPDVYELYKNAPGADAYPEDNSLIVLNETQRVVYDGGGSEEKHFLLIKVFNASGIDTWQEYYIQASGNQSVLIEKAEVIKKNGNKVEAEVDGLHCVFTSLEQGDAIHITYKIENYQFGKLAKHFWDKQYFSLYYPCQLNSYSLLIPPDYKFKYKITNSDLEPSREVKDDFVLYNWKMKDQESIKYEKYMSNLTDVGAVLHISSFPDWDYISKWYYDLATTKSKSDFVVKEEAKKLFADSGNLSDMEKAKIIYNYIVENIHYSSISFRQSGLIPQKASDVINTRMGDCKDVSTLFVALSKEAGLKANLILVNTRDNGLHDLELPSIDFNHCIADVTIDNKDYYVELTSDKLPFSSAGYSLKKAFALPVNEDTSVKIKPIILDSPTRLPNTVVRKTKVTFVGNKMIVKKHNVKSGVMAYSIRNIYRDIGEDARKKEMQQAIADMYPSVLLTNLVFNEDLNTTEDSIHYEYDYEVNNVFTSISNLHLFKLPWANAQQPLDFLANVERKYPIEFWQYIYADSYKEIITINIPEGNELAELPESVHYSCKIADYTMNFELKNNTLIVSREIRYHDDFVPTGTYNDFKQFFEKVVTSDMKQIAFKS